MCRFNRAEGGSRSGCQPLRPAYVMPADLSQRFAQIESVCADLQAAQARSSAEQQTSATVRELGMWLQTFPGRQASGLPA